MKKQLLFYKRMALAGIICAIPALTNAQVKISGQVFGDYAYKLHADSVKSRSSKAQYANSSSSGAGAGYEGFDIRRVYLGADYDISKKVHAQVNLANEDNVLGDGNRAFYLKAANITIKDIFSGSNLIIGQQTTPTFAAGPGSEATWGYRFVEKTVMDMRGIASSTDLGVCLSGKYANGNIGYDVLYGNNNGAKLETTVSSPNASADNAHRLYGDVYGRFLDKKIIVQLYGDFSSSDSTSKYLSANNNKKYNTSDITMKGFVAYTGKVVTVGGEVFTQTKTNAALDASGKLRDANPFGFSVFAHVGLIKDKDTSKNNRGDVLSVFARYDSFDPDTKTTGNLVSAGSAQKESFIVAGLDWVVAKNVHITPNIWINNYMTKTDNNVKDRSDNDMVGRVTFFWKF